MKERASYHASKGAGIIHNSRLNAKRIKSEWHKKKALAADWSSKFKDRA